MAISVEAGEDVLGIAAECAGNTANPFIGGVRNQVELTMRPKLIEGELQQRQAPRLAPYIFE